MSGGDDGQDQGRTRQSPRLADRLLLWLIGVPLLGVGINLLGEAVGASPWEWISAALFVVAVVATMPWGGGGFLRWERSGSREPARALAVVLVLGWLGITVWAGLHEWPQPVYLVQALLLWMAAVLTCWQTLRTTMNLRDAARGVALLLPGVTFLLFGVAFLRLGDTLFGVALLLFGVALLLFGVAAFRPGDTLVGVAVLLFGVAVLLFGVAFLHYGDALFGGGRSCCSA